MKKFFNRVIEFVSHIKAFFKPFEEELILGLDVEKLLKDPNRHVKVEHLLEINRKKCDGLTETYHVFMNEYIVVERISELSKELSLKLQGLCKQYSEMSIIRDEAEKRSTEAKKKAQETIGLYIEDIPKAISILKEHESHQQSVKGDLDILVGEKESLLYQFRNFKRALVFLRYFMIGLVAIALIAGVVLSTMLTIYDIDVFIPSLVVIIAIAFLFLWGFVFRRYCIHEINKNQVLYERALKLINKVKIKYVHNQQLLEFQYKKYKVNSSEVLELRYDNYLEAKDEARTYETIVNSMKSVVIDLDRQLNRLHIESTEFVLRHIDYFSTEKGIKSLRQQYEEERIAMQHELHKLEHEKEVLTNILTSY